ncbi:thiosulfate sulfurtransferase/rhodanese-like domain-containing protein 1 isoform X2 [Mizuhopecten yessoensis]|uniref:thiosulfate sulfurtransferase/rhodanese-like domain-containing protein 1 isoform X2 n=1 Tax=Mizuhopecten yessoensis TaxID=6573 RepID=UPI000B45750E|nr:thiosulfate sulfurtransferase/rhodanese-like domain-containing protein 1 isoform X2 [Mizuhopecten yessoensis]
MAGVSPMSRLFQRRQVWNILKLINKQSSFAAVRVSTPKACATLHGKCSKVQGQVQKDFRRHDSNCVKRTDVNFDDIISLLGSGSLQLIDVREPSELVQQGEFPTALNIPLGQVGSALNMAPHTFKALYGCDKPEFDDDNIVFACFAGIRSVEAMTMAHEIGYSKARQYAGGFKEWMEKTAEGEI